MTKSMAGESVRKKMKTNGDKVVNAETEAAAVSRYMAKIGKRGGEAGKGTEATREKCRRAAQARWAKTKKEKEVRSDKK